MDSFRSTNVSSRALAPTLPPDGEGPPTPGYKNYRLYCDESGFHAQARFYGFGALIIPDERRGDLPAKVMALRERHGFWHELKWSRLSRKSLPFALDVVRMVFEHKWILFHCMLVERKIVDMSFHDDKDQAAQKHFILFLRKRIEFLNFGATDKAYHLTVDQLPWRYIKQGEVTQKIANNSLRRDVGSDLVKSLTERNSVEVQGIQVTDLILGATLAAWQGDATAEPKRRVAREVALHLGWDDTKADTYPGEMKFNIWNFQDPREPRRAKTRVLKLLIPTTIYRSK